MKKLNSEAAESQMEEIKSKSLKEIDLTKVALDAEEGFALEFPSIYKNKATAMISKLKNMKLQDWLAFLDAWRAKQYPSEETRASRAPAATHLSLDTGLTQVQELQVLPRLQTKLAGLEGEGYVTSPPSPAEIQQARDGLKSSANYEYCDRCQARFRMFPERDTETGLLATNGPCVYHPGRAMRPRKGHDAFEIHGPSIELYQCCDRPKGVPGSIGCRTAHSHVLKVSDRKRMAAVMPFERTPRNDKIGPDKAVAFDCEMGYTSLGMELIRLTAVDWPSGNRMLDVLVRPLGTVIDLNTQFSGISAEMLNSALPYIDDLDGPDIQSKITNGEAHTSTKQLKIMDSPYEARRLLFSHLSPSTPLIAHAAENDLNAMRMIHPVVIDTAILFSRPKIQPGVPPQTHTWRRKLRTLVKEKLGRDIQTSGGAGHDSLEDARATGELVRHCVGREWIRMKDEGWTIKDCMFMPPVPKSKPATKTSAGAAGGIGN